MKFMRTAPNTLARVAHFLTNYSGVWNFPGTYLSPLQHGPATGRLAGNIESQILHPFIQMTFFVSTLEASSEDTDLPEPY